MGLAEDLRIVLALVKRRGITEEEHAAYARLRELGRGVPLPIYLAWSGEYEDSHVEAAFTERADAEALEALVEEMPLRLVPAEIRTWHQVVWYKGRPLQPAEETPLDRVPNPYQCRAEDRIADGPLDEIKVRRPTGPDVVGVEAVWVEGWDLELVLATVAALIAEES